MRKVRSRGLETRSSRLKLPIAKKPKFTKIRPGLGLGYRRNKTAGAWVARYSDGAGGNVTEGLGAADDYDDANGTTILTFEQAQDAALTRYRARTGQATAKPTTAWRKRSNATSETCWPVAASSATCRARASIWVTSLGERSHRYVPTSCGVGGIA